MKHRLTLLESLRRDRLAGLWLATLLLLVPHLQPLSEALAAGKPFAAEICTSFGKPDRAAAPVAADDCPDCLSGAHAPQPAFLPDGGDMPAAICPARAGTSPVRVAAVPGKHLKRWLAPPGQGPPSSG